MVLNGIGKALKVFDGGKALTVPWAARSLVIKLDVTIYGYGV
jgi:hypothetical protein